MAFLTTGTKTKSGGIVSALKKYSEMLNLQPAKKIVLKFDPFHETSQNMRLLSYYLNHNVVRQTNPACRIRNEIIVGEPTVEVSLNNGGNLLLKCTYLDPVEVIHLLNKHVTSLAPKKVEVEEVQVKYLSKKKKK